MKQKSEIISMEPEGKHYFESTTIRGIIISVISFVIAYGVNHGWIGEMPASWREWIEIIFSLAGFSGLGVGAYGRAVTNGEKLTWSRPKPKGTLPMVMLCLIFAACNASRDSAPLAPEAGKPVAKTVQTSFFVASNGSDSNPCSAGQPCATVTRATNLARGGDTVYVRGGSYDENEIWLNNYHGVNHQTGPGAYLVIKAYRGERPSFTNGNRPFIVEMPYVQVEGIGFANGKAVNGVADSCQGMRVFGCSFSGAGYTYAAIYMEGSDGLVYNNDVHILGNTQGTQGHGIYIARGKRNKVIGNRVSGTSGYGIHVFDQARSGDSAPRIIEDVEISYNTCYDSRERAGIIVAAQTLGAYPALAQNVTIWRNVVYDCAGMGIMVADNVVGILIANNTVYNINTDGIRANGEDAIYLHANVRDATIENNAIHLAGNTGGHHVYFESSASGIGRTNIFWPLPIRLVGYSPAVSDLGDDPLFVNTGVKDFYLQQISPAIDSGTPNALPFFGARIDRGALEYKPLGTSVE